MNLALSGRKCQISALRLVCPIAPYPRLQVFVFYSLCLLMRPCQRLPVQVTTSPSASVGVTVPWPSGSPGFASAPTSTSAKDAHTRPLHIFFSLGLRSAWEEKCLSFGSPRSSRRIKRKKRPGWIKHGFHTPPGTVGREGLRGCRIPPVDRYATVPKGHAQSGGGTGFSGGKLGKRQGKGSHRLNRPSAGWDGMGSIGWGKCLTPITR